MINRMVSSNRKNNNKIENNNNNYIQKPINVNPNNYKNNPINNNNFFMCMIYNKVELNRMRDVRKLEKNHENLFFYLILFHGKLFNLSSRI